MSEQTMKFCQSCGMPLQNDADHGKETDGSLNQDYCHYCYADGALLGDMTMEEMIESCVAPCLEAGAYPDADTARKAMREYFPHLKRWQKA
jgi:hypothetical protein